MKRLALILLLGAWSAAAWAEERPVMIRGARALGMGDAFTALADDQNVFFYNPAGSVQRTGALFTLVDVPVTVSQDFIKTVNFIDDNKTDLENFDKLSSDEQADLINKIMTEMVRLRPTFGLGLPNVSFLSGPTENQWHWGGGLFSQVSGILGFAPDVVTPSLYYDINADIVPMATLSKRIKMPFLPGNLGLGATGKFLTRAQAKDSHVSFLQLDSYSGPPLQPGHGLGLDLGLLYQPIRSLNIGATLMDAGGTQITYKAVDAQDGFEARPEMTDGIAQRLNIGLAWSPEKIGIGSFALPLHGRLLLAADVKDLLNSDSKTFLDGNVVADSAGKHIHLGAEYRWWLFQFRGGANQGYATAGVGMNLSAVKLDYAFFSDEQGAFAGSIKHSSHILSFALRFGSDNTEARERVADKGEKPGTAPSVPSAPAVPSETTTPPVAPAVESAPVSVP